MSAERDGLMRDILENPADDFPRLVFADWCEDNGEHERAGLIRGQIAGDILPARFVVEMWEGRPPHHLTCHGFPDGRRYADVQHLDMMRRALVGSADWVDTLPDGLHAGMDFTFSRGFVSEVRCSVNW